MAFVHQTVLLEEAVALLEPGKGKVIVDGTLGGGGHSEALLAGGASVIGVDRDPRAIAAATARLSGKGDFRAVEGNFGELPEILSRLGVAQVDGALVDLGISSPQIDEAERGFSFSRNGPLDMRMGTSGPTAAEVIEALDEKALAHVLRELGEEPFAGPIARALKKTLPKTTFEAADAISRAVPKKAHPKRIHVATRTFQALRILVNDELGALDRFLASLPNLLALHGRAAVIAFHSLEDRKVKEAFRDLVGRCTCPPGLPVCACGAQGSFTLLTRKAIAPSDEEVERNPRARSAHLRGVEKVR